MTRKKFKFVTYENAIESLEYLMDADVEFIYHDLDMVEQGFVYVNEMKSKDISFQKQYKSLMEILEYILITFEERQMFEDAQYLINKFPELVVE